MKRTTIDVEFADNTDGLYSQMGVLEIQGKSGVLWKQETDEYTRLLNIKRIKRDADFVGETEGSGFNTVLGGKKVIYFWEVSK